MTLSYRLMEAKADRDVSPAGARAVTPALRLLPRDPRWERCRQAASSP